MGSLDANQVWQYDGNDNVTPLATFMNLGQGSISDALADIRSDFTVPDTGWVSVPAAGGMTGNFEGRRVGDQVWLRGTSAPGAVWTLNTSKTIVSTLAAQFQPAVALHSVATSDAAVGDLYFHVSVTGANIIARPSRTTTGTSAISLNLTYHAT